MSAKLPSWVTHKFGGTSVANAERYKHVATLLDDKSHRTAIVVSAMSKVTDALIELTELARKRDSTYTQKLTALHQKHVTAIDELLPKDNPAALSQAEAVKKVFATDIESLAEILKSVWHVQSCSEQIVEFVSGHGEIWSAQLLHAYLQSQDEKTAWLDAREVLVVEPGETSVVVNWPVTQEKMNAWIEKTPAAQTPLAKVVITGFVASTIDGVPTTLKRNGSDYSAAIFGKLLSSDSITIWTDVDGVLSADPRLVPEAVVLPDLSYQETSELAYFGAKVVHPSTMAPAVKDAIPIWIRNTFNPNARGTKIHTKSTSDAPVKGFATVDNVSLINVEGSGMMGVPGVAQRLFGALREVGISVIMISQASSEHSICFAIPARQNKAAKQAVAHAFHSEIASGLIQSIDSNEDCSILAAVGDNMANQPGIAGKFLSALGRANVNVRAIAQGSSERNISVVVATLDSSRALRAVHASFFLSNHTLSIGIIGTGGIGATLITQLQEAAKRLRDEFKVDLRVRGLANSTRMRLSNHTGSLDLNDWKEDFKANNQPLDVDRFAKHIHADDIPHAVIVDCTSSEHIVEHYKTWLARGVHIVTPNKKGNTGSMSSYQELKKISRSGQHHYLYETTVGAGLPILNTLRELVQTGDRLISIEGVLSGTLSYIFNTFSTDRPFSDVVLEAKAKGYTEPDPREDLSGLDVARKLVILAREAGLSIELKDVSIEPLLPAELQTGSVDDFLKKLPIQDARMLKLASDAKTSGEVLRYVGQITVDGAGSGKASIVLRRYPANHPFAQTQSTDNIVAFRTTRYSMQPLIVQGPGAGPEVTAAGVFADILRLSSYLGASL